MDCVELFEKAPADSTRVKVIDAAAPDCQCELRQVSPHRPDPVQPDEVLVRLVLDPTHTETDNNVTRFTTALFSDAYSFGSSCLRNASALPEEYHRTVEAIVKDRPKATDGTLKSLFGVVLVPVSELKKIQHDIELPNKSIEKHVAFGVYATALEDRPSHADIMVNRAATISKSKANRATINLAKALQDNFISLSDLKNKIDLSHWSKSEVEKRHHAEANQDQ